MKKILVFLMTGLLMIPMAACSKKETAADVLEKVQQNSQEAFGQELDMDINYTVSGSGVEVKAELEALVLVDNANDLDNMTMSMDMNISMLGQSLGIDAWMTDGVLYMDAMGVKSKQELLSSELKDQVSGMTSIPTDGLKELLDKAVLETTDDGYTITLKDVYTADNLNEMFDSLGLSEMLGQSVSDLEEMFENVDIHESQLVYEISKDYILHGLTMNFAMTIDAEGETLDMVMTAAMNSQTYDTARVELPDLDEWDDQNNEANIEVPDIDEQGAQNVVCRYDDGALQEIMIISAYDDDISLIGSTMSFNYEAYGLIDEEDKESLRTSIMEIYGGYEGIDVSLEDYETYLEVTLIIDMSAVSIDSLVNLGIVEDDGVSYGSLSLTQSVTNLTNSGYACQAY